MPNWCNTNYKLLGDANEIADLYEKLKELEDMPEPLVESGFGNLYLGCIINHLGGDYENIDCRGEIDSLELCGENMIQLTTTTAWADKREVWDFVCKKYPSITYYYLSEEPGMGYYINSDESGEYFPEKYYIYHNEGYSEYVEDDQELLEYIAQKIGVSKINNIEELNLYLDMYNEENPDGKIFYYEFTSPK